LTKERDHFNKLYSTILSNGVRQDEDGEWTKINSSTNKRRMEGKASSVGGESGENSKEWVPSKVLLGPLDVENKWYEQDGRCYWFGIPLNLGLLYNDHPGWYPKHPLAPSIDKIDPDGDYTYDNIVICTRFANFGRNVYPFDGFHQVVALVAESMLSRETSPAYIRQILANRQQQKATAEAMKEVKQDNPRILMEEILLINPGLKEYLERTKAVADTVKTTAV
jgi:hypothetical protein